MLYSGSMDNTVRLWDLEHGRVIRIFNLRSPVVGLAPSPDGKSLAIRTVDGQLQLWDIITGQLKSDVQLTVMKP